MRCKHCGRAISGEAQHEECTRLHSEGWTDAQITAKLDGRSVGVPVQYIAQPLTFRQVVGAVILGNIIVDFAASLLWFITH